MLISLRTKTSIPRLGKLEHRDIAFLHESMNSKSSVHRFLTFQQALLKNRLPLELVVWNSVPLPGKQKKEISP